MQKHSLQHKHRKRAAALSLAVVLGATPFAVAMTAESAVASAPARMKGTITAAGGGVLGGIRVSALSLMPVDGVNQWVEVDAAYSGADGRYNVGKLADGSYRLRFYDPSGVFATEFYDNVPRADMANDIALTGGNTVRSGLDAELGGAAHITGKVTDNLGAALTGAVVTAYVQQVADQQTDWVPYQSVRSTADGSYDLGGLPAGNYTLGFSDPASGAAEYWNDEKTLAEADKVGVANSGTTAGFDVSLDTGATRPPAPAPTVSEPSTANQAGSSTATAAGTTTAAAAPASAAAIRVLTKPRIKGVRMVGRKLRVTKGAFSPSAVERKVQWLADGKRLKRATGTRLKLRPALRGKRISVRVTVSVPGDKMVVKSPRTRRIRPAA